jgi:hypothetical protein
MFKILYLYGEYYEWSLFCYPNFNVNKNAAMVIIIRP